MARASLFPSSVWCLICSTAALAACGIARSPLLQSDSLAAQDSPLAFPHVGSAWEERLSPPYRAGVAIGSLLPAEPASLTGFGGGLRRILPPQLQSIGKGNTYCRRAEGVLDAPAFKLLLLEGRKADGSVKTAVLLSLDLVAVTQDISMAVERRLKVLAQDDLAFDQGNVQVLATHTHSGPAGLSNSPLWGPFACDRYLPAEMDLFLERVAVAYREAQRDLVPVDAVAVTEASLEGLVESRIPGMAVDTRASLVEIGQRVGTGFVRTACIAALPVHPTWFGTANLRLTRDVAGAVEDALAGAAPCFFVQGIGGNSTPKRDASATHEAFGVAVRARFDAAASTRSVETLSAQGALVWRARITSLPRPEANLRACGASFVPSFLLDTRALDWLPRRTKLAVLGLGSVSLRLFPGEMVRSLADAADLPRAGASVAAAARQDVVVTLANDYTAYHLPAPDLSRQSLESCSSLYGRASETLARELRAL